MTSHLSSKSSPRLHPLKTKVVANAWETVPSLSKIWLWPWFIIPPSFILFVFGEYRVENWVLSHVADAMLDLAPDKILTCVIVQRLFVGRASPQVLKIIIPTRMNSWLLRSPISKRLPVSLLVFLPPLPVDHTLLKRIEVADIRYSLYSLRIYVLIKLISPLIMSEECLYDSIFIQGH